VGHFGGRAGAVGWVSWTNEEREKSSTGVIMKRLNHEGGVASMFLGSCFGCRVVTFWGGRGGRVSRPIRERDGNYGVNSRETTGHLSPVITWAALYPHCKIP